VQLSDFDKSRVRYHLGYYVVSVPAGDYARLEESMNTVPDSYFLTIKLSLRLDAVILLKLKNRSLLRHLLLALKVLPETLIVRFVLVMLKRALKGLGWDLSLRNQPTCTNPVCSQLQGSNASKVPIRKIWCRIYPGITWSCRHLCRFKMFI